MPKYLVNKMVVVLSAKYVSFTRLTNDTVLVSHEFGGIQGQAWETQFRVEVANGIDALAVDLRRLVNQVLTALHAHDDEQAEKDLACTLLVLFRDVTEELGNATGKPS